VHDKTLSVAAVRMCNPDRSPLFVDVSDLIAMQEGRDVLAGAFTRTET